MITVEREGDLTVAIITIIITTDRLIIMGIKDISLGIDVYKLVFIISN